MKRILAGLLAMAATAAAAYTMLTVPDETQLYVDDADPFAIGVSTAAYTHSTNAVTKQTTLTFNGEAWQLSSNGVFSAATVAQGAKADTALQPADTNGWETGAHTAFLTNETDAVALAALAAHSAYWPPNATASSWFTFITNSGAITLTGYDIGGGTDVVIPDYINGWPVTEIGANAFDGSGVTSIGGAGNVVAVEDSAFENCTLLASISLPQVQTVGAYAFMSCFPLASVSLPQVQTVGNNAFSSCDSLTSVSFPQVQTVGNNAFDYCGGLASLYFDNEAPTIGADIFAGLSPNQVTNYVTNPTATGWGDTLGGMPVVRLPLYADAITLGGVERTDWPEEADLTSPYTQWTAQVPVIDGTATVAIAHGNMPYLVCTNATVMTLDPTGYSTGGVSRVSLSVYTGGQTFTLATNVITYATAPTISTNDWNTVLIRRVGNGTWKGVGL